MPQPTIVRRSIELPHPPEDVFGAVMSPEIAPLIDPAVRRWEPDSRPIRSGTRFSIRGRFQWLPIRATSVVTVWQPPRCATFDAVTPRWPTALEAEHAFETTENGTRYTWTMMIHPRGTVGRLATRLLAPLLDRTIADQQETLSAWLDQNPGAAATAEL